MYHDALQSTDSVHHQLLVGGISDGLECLLAAFSIGMHCLLGCVAY